MAHWYAAQGYQILDRNWRVREGEVDLVLGAGGVVAFCEVKTRRGDAYGTPFEAVTPTKQRRLRSLALRWLAEHPVRARELRFDVAAVRVARDGTVDVDVRTGAF